MNAHRRGGRHSTIPILLVFSLAACEGRSGAEAGPPTAVLDDSVRFLETDSAYLARPGALAVDERGDAYVADFFRNRVLRFDRGGRPVRAYGQPGYGPGELGSVAGALFVHGEVLGVLDDAPAGLEFYDRRTGAFLGGRRLERAATAGGNAGGILYLSSLDAQRALGLIRWPIRTDSLGDGEAAALAPNFAPLPDEYARIPAMRGIYGLAHVAAWADTVLVGYAGSPFLLELRADGSVRDTVHLPARRRRGVPAELARRLQEPGRPFPELFSLASGLFGVHRRTDGSFVLVHFDSEFHPGNRITSRVFLSLLSADRRRACVDREVPASTDAQPVVAFRGDSVYLLDQRIGGDEAVSTTLWRYRVTSDGCTWLSTDRAGDAR